MVSDELPYAWMHDPDEVERVAAEGFALTMGVIRPKHSSKKCQSFGISSIFSRVASDGLITIPPYGLT
jgi:hypothetical protein